MDNSSSSSSSTNDSDDSFDSFYEAYRHHVHRHHHDNNESSDDTSFDEDEESVSSMDTDNEEGRLDQAIAQINNNQDHNNNNVGNNQNNQPAASANVRERPPNNLAELRSCFPLTLKNLSRIRIKQSMSDYNKDNVLAFVILPDVLKQFVCFQDEIDSIKRLTERNDDNDADIGTENCMDATFV